MEDYRPITQWNEDDKPREKLTLKGRHTLSDAELLAILLGTGARFKDKNGYMTTRSAVDLGRDILQAADNNLLNLSRMNTTELKQLPGIGEAKAISVIAALELGSRRKMAKDERTKITCSRDAYNIIAPHLEDLLIEQCWVIFLNKGNKVLNVAKLSEGGITGTIVDPGPLFKMALLENARSLILCHNHPSGNLKPSDQDIQITKKMKNAGNLLEIDVSDHLIVTNQGYYSFGDQGIM